IILRERGWGILSIAVAKKRAGLQMEIGFLTRVGTKDLVIFSRQLAVMMTAQVPIVQALRTVIDQTSNVTLRAAVSAIGDDVEAGAPLSQALAQHPKIFPNFFVNMIRSGESAGKLDDVLEYLASQQEKDYDLVTKVRGAMIYPIFILGGLIVVAIVMMIFVIPKLTSILIEAKAQLPITTRMLIATSNFFVDYWWVIILLVVAGVMTVQVAIRNPKGRYWWDWLKLRIPIFGKLLQEITLVRFLRSLGTLLKGGVPLPKGMEIVRDIVGNAVYQQLLDFSIKEVRDGHSMASVFKGQAFIPTMVPQMFTVGERTGTLDKVLETLANFYTREVDNKVTNLVSLIEPLVIVVMGIGVGIMVTAILLPIYNLAGTF
ncbi:type II secretion system F family protein, partial [Candidatus Uhrbacteria bacterium]|nr:type II secretion system F family protein [Candidatus Uhrbacteria bacterium]